MLKGIQGFARAAHTVRWIGVAALLCGVIVVGCAPAVAWAADADAETGSETMQARVSVADWNALASAVSAGGDDVIEVSGSLTAGEAIEVASGNVTVNISEGSSITRSGSTTTFVVKSGATLTVTGAVTVNGGAGSFVVVEQGGTLNVNGAITADGVNGSASFIDVAGALTMGESAKISGWTDASNGSTVNVHGSSSVFTMRGGEISGNTANRMGAGVRLVDAATMIMTGGAIKDNTLPHPRPSGSVPAYTSQVGRASPQPHLRTALLK